MATNDFQPFAYGGAANVVSQSAYLALTTILQNGFSSGVAQSAQLNKVWRQSSIMAAVLAQFAADYSGNNSTDDGTTATLETNLIAAIRSATKTGVILADTGAANAYTAVNVPPLVAGTWIDGVVQEVKIAHANTGASTYAPDGLTAIPIYGLGLQPLQGGELALNGTAVLMHATIAGVNGGNPICVLMECAGGAQQTPPATQSQHAVQLGQVAGVVGSARNLAMNVAAASTTATLTADEIIVESALGGLRYCLSSFNKAINLATTGAGGMDAGGAPSSGYVAIYVIYNPKAALSATNPALLAQNAAGLAPNIYGGANMPAGYTASALVSVWPTNASGQLAIGTQRDRDIGVSNVTVLNSSAIAVNQSLSIASVVPQNAIKISGSISVTSTAQSNITLAVLESSAAAGNQQTTGLVGAGLAFGGPFSNLKISSSQIMFYSTANSAGTPTFTIFVSGYSI